MSTTTWGDVESSSLQLVSALEKLGLNNGDRLATIAWNNQRHLKVWFAVSGSDMVCHTLNPRLFPEQLIFIVNDAADKAIFFDKTFMPLIVGTRDHLKTVEYFIYLGPRDDEVAAAIPDVIFFDELITSGASNYQWPVFNEDSPCSLTKWQNGRHLTL